MRSKRLRQALAVYSVGDSFPCQGASQTVTGAILALDLGTSALKAGLVRTGEGLIAVHAVPYRLARPSAGAAEQDPEDWWTAACRAVGRVREDVGPSNFQPSAVVVTGQMHGVVARDGRGRALRPCLTWADERGERHLEWMKGRVDPAQVLAITANPLSAGMSAAKLVWLRATEPEVWRQTRSVLFPKDELRFRLTGEAATDPSDASGSLLFDAAGGVWSEALTEGWEVDESLLPPIRAAGSEAGPVLRDAAAALNIGAETPVLIGAGDTLCAALGVGVSRDGVGLLGLGTAAQILAATNEAVVDNEGRLNAFHVAAASGWCSVAATLDGGGALSWFASLLGLADGGLEVLLDEAAHVPIGASRVTFVAHLSGERTPGMDPASRASFHGLGMSHGRGELARAVLEGVAFALREGLEAMRSLDAAPAELRMAGGGGRSDVWRGILADVLGLPITVADIHDSTIVGAALLATSVRDGPETLYRIDPDPSRMARYDQVYEGYLEIRRQARGTVQ